MTQLDLLSLPVIHLKPYDPAQERDRILKDLERRNGERFVEKGCAEALRYLRQHGPSSGETITDALKAAGIVPKPGSDDRSYGTVYSRLSRHGLIEKGGSCVRKKGHSTQGGVIWQLT